MPKNKGKGGKNRRRGKNENDNDKRELIFKEEGQDYGLVKKMLGNGRLEVQCLTVRNEDNELDKEPRLGNIRGKMRKKVWINQGDIVLVSLREYEHDKVDIIGKYSPDEARKLKQFGELPEKIEVNEGAGDEEDGGDDAVDFESGSESVDMDDL